MSTINLTTSEANVGKEAGTSIWVRRRISMATNNVTAADTLKIFKIPKYGRVNTFQVTTVTAAGTTCTMDFGTLDGVTADTTGLDATVNLNTTATMTRGAFGTDAKIGYRFAADGYITGTAGHTNSTGVFDVIVEIVIDQDHD